MGLHIAVRRSHAVLDRVHGNAPAAAAGPPTSRDADAAVSATAAGSTAPTSCASRRRQCSAHALCGPAASTADAASTSTAGSRSTVATDAASERRHDWYPGSPPFAGEDADRRGRIDASAWYSAVSASADLYEPRAGELGTAADSTGSGSRIAGRVVRAADARRRDQGFEGSRSIGSRPHGRLAAAHADPRRAI